ncbi:MAG: alanine racemase [Erythrobacter sp.]|uniref:alanine racemase n=1 Tax=Erythrobacter sp. TaxID=1042 RepID=UPI003297FF47
MLSPERSLRLRVDQEALAHNWRGLDTLSGMATAGAAVKANCYGLGVDTCVPTLRDAGCESFFVAHWSEVVALAAHVAPRNIAVLHGPMHDDDVAYAKASGAVPVINSLAQARRWNGAAGGACHLMIDTGINRLGVAPSELSDPAVQALNIDIVMSHLSSADEETATNAKQLQSFRECLPLINFKRASLCNSAGIALGRDYAFDLTRPGIALYGGVPRHELRGTIRQVAHVEVAVIQTRMLNKGDTVGYNTQFVAPSPMPVGTVSLGYADGFLRSRGAGNALLHEGMMLPILGKVSMDMIVVDLSAAPGINEGAWLQVPFDLPNAAQQSSLSQYELLTVLGSRWG